MRLHIHITWDYPRQGRYWGDYQVASTKMSNSFQSQWACRPCLDGINPPSDDHASGGLIAEHCHLHLLAPDILSCLPSISCGHISSTPLYTPFSCHEATSWGHCYLNLPAVSPEFLFALLSLGLTELFQEVLSAPQDPSESVCPK